jgi:DNA-binding response OmpR family regulator
MRILIVEDEPKVSGFVQRGLTAARYEVDVCADGHEGLKNAQAFPYDLIIFDLTLPLLDGQEVLPYLRRGNACVPVLILTAKNSIAEKVKLFEFGADDYLTKPFSFAELLVRAEALFRHGPLSQSSTTPLDNPVPGRLTHHVKRNGNWIELTPKEYSLLKFLIYNEGRVLSRRMIIDHTNFVDVYVRQLRAKVDVGHTVKLIHTVHGSGYVILRAAGECSF